MSTVIYFSNKQIQVVCSRGSGMNARPYSAYTMASPEGSVINGIIMDPDALAPFIKGFFEYNKISLRDVSLVINSSKIAGKRIELPKMSDTRTLEFVSREFNDLSRDEAEPVFSYTGLAGEKGSKVRKLYAETIDSEFIRDYVELFAGIGIQLKGIYSSEGTMIRMIEQTAGKRCRNFVVQVADDNMLINVLWAEGNFVYYSGQRCFNEPGTEEYMEECVRALSQLTQFMKANQMDTPIQNIYVAGIKDLDIDAYRQLTAASRIEASVDWFDCGLAQRVGHNFDLTGVLPALAGLFGQDRNNNLLNGYIQMKKEKKTDAFWTRSIILMVSVFLLMLLLTLIFGFRKKMTEDQLMRVRGYNEDPAVLMELALYDQTVNEMITEFDRKNSYGNVKNAVETFPVFDDKIREPLERCAQGYAEIELSSFDAIAGVLSFTANSERVQDINKFIERVQDEEIFSSVSYSGYSLNEKDNTWNIHVTCILAEGAGR
ncbi:MAG: hypothetical protein K6B44_12625 [Lachnospiraceae bacterium]|nr:hypothetical protein [Lachnospiraceae bacterium]